RLCGVRVARSPEDGHAGEFRNSLLQKFQSFPAYLWGKGRQSSNVSSRSCKASDESVGNGVANLRHDNGNRSCRFFGGTGCCRTTRDDDIHLETHQLGDERRNAIKFSLCRSPLNDNVFPLYVPKFAQTLPE